MLLLERAVDDGSVILPISAIHLIELMKAESPGRRTRLAAVFDRFCTSHFVAPWWAVAPVEIQNAVVHAYSGGSLAAARNVFGTGFLFAFGAKAAKHPENDAISPRGLTFGEFAALPGRILDVVSAYSERARARQNQSIAEMNRGDATSIDSYRRTSRRSTTDALRQAKFARYTFDFQEELKSALSVVQVSLADFLSSGARFLTEFWRTVPSLYSDCELTLYRNRQWSRQVDPNDFADIGHLVIGVPYCSVVVVERFWERALEETLLASHFQTTVCRGLEGLAALL
ncbi:MAG: hypothetical protein ABI639_09995 [Thermoanaerobaculia bacterium]